jgi:hypothetical protein
MTDEPDTITLRFLRRLDEKLDRPGDQLTDVSAGLRGVKTHRAGFMQHEVATDGALASIRDRLQRIERRLDLSD